MQVGINFPPDTLDIVLSENFDGVFKTRSGLGSLSDRTSPTHVLLVADIEDSCPETLLPRGCPVDLSEHLRKAGNTGELSFARVTLILEVNWA